MKIELTNDDVQQIIEALLFCSYSSMCATWESFETEQFMNIAFKLSDDTGIPPRPEKITYYDGIPEDEELYGEKIKEKFPNLIRSE